MYRTSNERRLLYSLLPLDLQEKIAYPTTVVVSLKTRIATTNETLLVVFKPSWWMRSCRVTYHDHTPCQGHSDGRCQLGPTPRLSRCAQQHLWNEQDRVLVPLGSKLCLCVVRFLLTHTHTRDACLLLYVKSLA